VYFQNYSEETAKPMSGNNKEEKVYKYPLNVDGWIEYQARKADNNRVECLDYIELIFQVNEQGGTTRDDVQ
jgi:hypothetical protein